MSEKHEREDTTEEEHEESTEESKDLVAKQDDKEEEEEEKAEEIEEFMEEIPSHLRKSFMMEIARSSRPATHPLFDKFKSDHIHKFLDYIQRDDDNEYKLRSSNRWFHLTYTLIGIGLFVFLLVYLLPTDRTLLADIFKVLLGAIGGFGGGYGYSRLRQRR